MTIKDCPKGRPKVTGRYQTREELEKNVVELWDILKFSLARIARHVEVSPATVNKILENHWRKSLDNH